MNISQKIWRYLVLQGKLSHTHASEFGLYDKGGNDIL